MTLTGIIFGAQQSLEFAENGTENKKHPGCNCSGGREEGPDWSKVTIMQITTHCNSGMQRSISEHTMCQTSYLDRLQQQKTNKSKK